MGWGAVPLALQIKLPPPPFVTFPLCPAALPSTSPKYCFSHHPSLSHTHPQDEALRLGPPRRGGERGAAEKKIAILEKALSLHPGSDELLLALLHAVGGAGRACVSCIGVGIA